MELHSTAVEPPGSEPEALTQSTKGKEREGVNSSSERALKNHETEPAAVASRISEGAGARQNGRESNIDERTQPRTQTPPERLFGTWVAEDVPTDFGQVRVELTFRKKGRMTILAWSELPFVGKVRDIQGPFRVQGDSIISKAIRGGTRVSYTFEGDDLLIRYDDGKTVRFHRK